MSYEFNPDTSAPELPNPYRVENQCLIAAGVIALTCGLVLLYFVHHHLVVGFDGRAFLTLALASGLLLLGITLVWFACTQLRFLFGRNRPVGLAPELHDRADGTSPRADYYKETLRQNAIRFAEPHGALSGVLYAALPDLIFAPQVLRIAAQKLLHRLLSLAAILVSYLVCWGVTSGTPGAAWIGLVYAVIAAPMLLLPLRDPLNATGEEPSETQGVEAVGLVVMIVAAVIGPLLIAKLASVLPQLGDFSINGVLALALLSALAGCGVFGLALKNQLQPMPQAVGAARVQEAMTINTHPSKLVEELDRMLMERWVSRIPNRKYTRRSPQVYGSSGVFAAEVFEETQPCPQAGRVAAGLREALDKPYFRFLAVLTMLAAAFLACSAIAATVAGHAALQGQAFSISLAFAISQMAVSLFCFRAAHVLWGRFDFVSELIWVDMSGSYEAARVNVGNQFVGNLHTSKNVINIEAMTLRVWVSEIDTVIFGKDAPRQLVGMRGLQGKADELAKALLTFGEAQAMVVAPRSAEDLKRVASISAANTNDASWPQLDARRAASAIRSQGNWQNLE